MGTPELEGVPAETGPNPNPNPKPNPNPDPNPNPNPSPHPNPNPAPNPNPNPDPNPSPNQVDLEEMQAPTTVVNKLIRMTQSPSAVRRARDAREAR